MHVIQADIHNRSSDPNYITLSHCINFAIQLQKYTADHFGPYIGGTVVRALPFIAIDFAQESPISLAKSCQV